MRFTFSLFSTSFVTPTPKGAAALISVRRDVSVKLSTAGVLARKSTTGGTIGA